MRSTAAACACRPVLGACAGARHTSRMKEEIAVLFSLNEDQLAIQELVRRVAREKVAPRAAEIDRTGAYPQDMFDLQIGRAHV